MTFLLHSKGVDVGHRKDKKYNLSVKGRNVNFLIRRPVTGAIKQDQQSDLQKQN